MQIDIATQSLKIYFLNNMFSYKIDAEIFQSPCNLPPPPFTSPLSLLSLLAPHHRSQVHVYDVDITIVIKTITNASNNEIHNDAGKTKSATQRQHITTTPSS